jgi:hypothetical protein
MGILDDIEKATEEVEEAQRPLVHSLAGLTVVHSPHMPPNGVVVCVGTELWGKIKRWRKVRKACEDGDMTLTLTGFDEEDS